MEYHKRLIDLGFVYVEFYKEGKFNMEMLATCPSLLNLVVRIYRKMVSSGEIEAIESLDLLTKEGLWEACKPFIGPLSKERRIDFARCYWCLDQIAAREKNNKNF